MKQSTKYSVLMLVEFESTETTEADVYADGVQAIADAFTMGQLAVIRNLTPTAIHTDGRRYFEVTRSIDVLAENESDARLEASMAADDWYGAEVVPMTAEDFALVNGVVGNYDPTDEE